MININPIPIISNSGEFKAVTLLEWTRPYLAGLENEESNYLIWDIDIENQSPYLNEDGSCYFCCTLLCPVENGNEMISQWILTVSSEKLITLTTPELIDDYILSTNPLFVRKNLQFINLVS